MRPASAYAWQLARACSPATPELFACLSEQWYPANAGVLLKGRLWGRKLDGTIDGVEVDVVIDKELSTLFDYQYDLGYQYNVMVVRTDPAPGPGQTVHTYGDPCTTGLTKTRQMKAKRLVPTPSPALRLPRVTSILATRPVTVPQTPPHRQPTPASARGNSAAYQTTLMLLGNVGR